MTEAGRILGDRYRVARSLGGGPLAHTLDATDLSSGARVVVRIARRPDDPQATARLAREAEILGRLRGPRFPRLLAWNPSDTSAYSVIEFLEGQALDQREGEGIAWETLRPFIEQAAEALDALHAAGFVHCDVKPANLFCTPGGVKLIDFNVSLPIGEASGGQFVGSPRFMAPELWRAEPVSPATDVYALAATVFLLASGRALFAGDTPIAWMRAHLDAPSPSLASAGVAASPAAETALAASLAKAPEARPGRASELAARLWR